jgi:hypothetical protein
VRLVRSADAPPEAGPPLAPTDAAPADPARSG